MKNEGEAVYHVPQPRPPTPNASLANGTPRTRMSRLAPPARQRHDRPRVNRGGVGKR